MKKKLGLVLSTIALLLTPLTLVATPVTLADSVTDACNGIGGTRDLSGCKINGSNRDVTGTVKSVIQILGFVVGAVAVIMIIVGAMRYITSGGDSNSIAAAKNTLIYAVVGLVIALLAEAIVKFVFTKASS